MRDYMRNDISNTSHQSNLSTTVSSTTPTSAPTIWQQTPKIIWMLWFQGYNDPNLPLVQQLCIKSWLHYNVKHNWTFILLNNTNIPLYMNATKYHFYKQKQENGAMGLAGLSNIVRLELLSNIGGVWVDSSVFCTKPLNEWLPNYVTDAPFFAFHRKKTVLSSWFLFANSSSYIINEWNIGTDQYWENRTHMHTYHWMHWIFERLKNHNKKFKYLWSKKVKHFDSEIPHYIIANKKEKTRDLFQASLQLNPKIKDHIQNHLSPLYKMTAESRHNEQKTVSKSNESVLDFLFNTIPHQQIDIEHFVNKYGNSQQILN